MSRTLGRFSISRVQPLLNGGAPTTAITYGYDPLYRLTSASYSSGGVFTYTYDAVGNRLTQQTLAGTTAYVYDAANRMVNAGAITLTWDANGNLLNDGVYTYTYDTANRLTGMNGSGPSSSYAYNGQGDRLRQVTGGVTTTYTLDLNAGLTQVLADGANMYLYGLSRLGEQQPSGASTGSGQGWAYHLPDALGSVRQLTNASGGVTLAKGYEPYGAVLSSVGSGSSVYAFTGEQYDSQTGLVYLRARYYAPGVGRFVTRDTWTGDVGRPLSLNAWNYVESDPINRFDPAGLCADCFVFYFGGLGTWDAAARDDFGIGEDKQDFLTRLASRTGATVISLYPYGPGSQSDFAKNYPQSFNNVGHAVEWLGRAAVTYAGNAVRVLSAVADPLIPGKAFEVLQNLPGTCSVNEGTVSPAKVDFIGYSGGAQMAYAVANALNGKVKVQNLVLVGPVFQAFGGMTSIGRLWDLRTDTDKESNGWIQSLGWEDYNRGFREHGVDLRLPVYYGGERDIYQNGARRCAVIGGGGHADYWSRDASAFPDEGFSCQSGSVQISYPGSRTRNRFDALLDFMINVIGVGRHSHGGGRRGR